MKNKLYSFTWQFVRRITKALITNGLRPINNQTVVWHFQHTIKLTDIHVTRSVSRSLTQFRAAACAHCRSRQATQSNAPICDSVCFHQVHIHSTRHKINASKQLIGTCYLQRISIEVRCSHSTTEIVHDLVGIWVDISNLHIVSRESVLGVANTVGVDGKHCFGFWQTRRVVDLADSSFTAPLPQIQSVKRT